MITVDILRTRPVAPVIVDFGWYYGTTISPTRLPEDLTPSFAANFPYGNTTLSNTTTFPSSSNVQVASTVSFEQTGTLVVYEGLGPSQRTTATYVIVDNTHFEITGGTGTFAAGTPVFDPRYYADSVPLNVNVILDAQDGANLGLPTVTVPAGVSVSMYRWNFGNGEIGYGSSAQTTYPYSIPPPNMKVSLSVFDSLGRVFSVSKPLPLIGTTPGSGSPDIIRQSNLSYR